MRTRRLLAALGTTAALSLSALVPGVAPAGATTVPTTPVAPTITRLGVLARYFPASDLVRVTVRYRCLNTAQQVTYVLLDLHQGDGATYVRGWRGDTGGLLTAVCDGHVRLHAYNLLRSSYALPTDPALTRGLARLTVSLAPRSLPENGGWYVPTGPDVTRARTVYVLPES